MAGQSVLQSWLETAAQTIAGMVAGYAVTPIVLPLFGLHPLPPVQNMEMTGLFTAVSIARGIVLRRAFNALHVWQSRER